MNIFKVGILVAMVFILFGCSPTFPEPSSLDKTPVKEPSSVDRTPVKEPSSVDKTPVKEPSSGFVELRGGTQNPTPDSVSGFTVLLSTEKPGMMSGGQISWLVTNTRNQPLVIKGVSYNGEWAVPLATRDGYHRVEKGFPVTLTIGEFCRLFQFSIFEDKVKNSEVAPLFGGKDNLTDKEKKHSEDRLYRKVIIYMDFDTNRGRFRYFPDENILKEPNK